MENEVKNDVTVVTTENKKATKKEKKPWNWKSFGLGTGVGAGLLLLGATIMTMISGGENNSGSEE